MRSQARVLGVGALLFGAYLATARLGLLLDAVAGFATLVWPPTGISLVALFLFGERLWPAVALAAIATNLAVGASVPVACAIGIGNALEAVAGARLLRAAAFRPQLDRVRDVVALTFLGAMLSTMASAAIGVFSLWAGGVLRGGAAMATVRAWWVGDMLGDLAMAPLLFVWLSRPWIGARRWLWAEAFVLFAALAAVSAVVLTQPHPGLLTQPYMVFPLLALVAWRLGPYGAATGVFLVAAISVAGATLLHTPFVRPTLNESLLLLQIFVGVASLTTLVLGAAIAERNLAVQARDEFLSIASHELSTPLTALSLHVQGQLRVAEKAAEPREQLEATRRMVARLAKLIQELLDISRISAGRMQLERGPVDLAALVRDGVARFAQQIAHAKSAVQFAADQGVTGQWDRARLDQVLDNLLSNALKFGAGRPIEIAVRATGPTARMEVRDHGIGIDATDQSRVFERFERAVSRQRFGGFGLGLWIARQVIEAHGGTISVSSVVGRGSTFVVELPRSSAPPPAPAEAGGIGGV
jgi:signal transduction histidine kinase